VKKNCKTLKVVLFSLMTVFIIMALLTSCTQSASTTKTTTASQPVSQTQQTTTSSSATTSQSTQTNWWDTKFGTPQYGGTIAISTNNIQNAFDAYSPMNTNYNYYMEPLFIIDPTVDRIKADFTSEWISPDYWKGNIAQSWEWSDAQNMVVHLRQDVYWQNKAPVNGRQFTADDVVYHFDRVLGTGNGFTTPDPFLAGSTGSLQKVTAQDKFTVIFTYGTPATFANSETILATRILQSFEAKEVFDMSGPSDPSQGVGFNSALNDWHNAVGTGAFILSDCVENSIVSYSKNANYWAYDEKYPKNRLPYVDKLNVVFIADPATELAALRTGKTDVLNKVNWQQAAKLQQTNPELLYGPVPQPGFGLQLRSDIKPFSDINVRKAMQMAIDLPAIAKGWAGGTVDWKPVAITNPDWGFAVPYDEWSQELKDEYSYNPEKAKQLLTDAGYPNGFSVTCDASTSNFPWPGGPEGSQFLQMLKSYYTDINVEINIQQFDFPILNSMLGARKQHEVVLMGTLTTMAPLTAITRVISTEPSNGIAQNDPKFDQMVSECSKASSAAEAKKMVSAVNTYFLEQHWLTTTFQTKAYVFWQGYFQGYSGENMMINSYSCPFARYWIDQN
jgi:peptide/nickel transport system substrate-binding protein